MAKKKLIKKLTSECGTTVRVRISIAYERKGCERVTITTVYRVLWYKSTAVFKVSLNFIYFAYKNIIHMMVVYTNILGIRFNFILNHYNTNKPYY